MAFINAFKRSKYAREIWVAITCCGLMGIAFPNIAGLITNSNYIPLQLVFHYLYFIAIAFAVWQGNIFILSAIRKKAQWRNNRYYKMVFLLAFLNIVFSGITSFALLFVWKFFSKENYTGIFPQLLASIVIAMSAVIVTNFYEIIYLYGERETSTVKAEELNLSKIKAELEALKNQIDPHFIFNALNTLSYLIVSNPENAKLYTNTLANVYRYILVNKEKDFVHLKEEIEFLSNYFFLLKIRFGNSVKLQVEINYLEAEEFLIPPISLQVLIENAIKHNDFSDTAPLGITVSVKSNSVFVKNFMRPKSFPIYSTKTGLENLNERYTHLIKKGIIVFNSNNYFIIKLPLIKKQ